MDALTYDYTGSGNQLNYITDSGDITKGFKDGNTTGNDYDYDANGNMTIDLNKGIDHISYNHLNLPDSVHKITTGEYMKYIYNAEGVKLAQEVYDGIDPEPTKRTDYIGEFIYENDTLQLIQHEEGRVVPNPITGAWEYTYHLKDHLGNTRVTFTTAPKTHEFKLNYESNVNLKDDEASFDNMDNVIIADIHDHTDAGTTYTKSQKLTGANGSIIGSVLTVPVGKGDQINAEVYAKYLAATGTSNPVASIGAAVIGAITGNTGSTNYEGAIGSSFGTDGSMITNVFGDQIDDNMPRAFINLMFLPDEVGSDIGNENFAFAQVTNNSDNAHATLELSEAFEAPTAGYVVVYLSNESSMLTEVYFDDLQVTINESKIVQKDDYYPFGLSYHSWKRTTAKENKLNTFQNQELITDLGLDWVQFKWRNHDRASGRFFNIDPLAETYLYNSPYAFSENHVTTHVELEGLEKGSIHRPSVRRSTRTFRPGGNPSTIREVASAASRNHKSSFASMSSRQNASYTKTTRYNVGRGIGQSSTASNNFGRSENAGGIKDNTHSYGNRAGNAIKAGLRVVDQAKKMIDNADQITTVESFSEVQGVGFSTGVDYMVNDGETTFLLGQLETAYHDSARSIAQGDLTSGEFSNLSNGERSLKMSVAYSSLGSSPLQMVQERLKSSEEENVNVRRVETVSAN